MEKSDFFHTLYFFFVLMNIVTFFMYGADKIKAIKKKNRISEMTLLNFSLFGGAIGGLLAMYCFHHKTRKKLFVYGNLAAIVVHVFIYLYLIK